jgi:hypothetical protein
VASDVTGTANNQNFHIASENKIVSRENTTSNDSFFKDEMTQNEQLVAQDFFLPFAEATDFFSANCFARFFSVHFFLHKFFLQNAFCIVF